MRSTTRLPLLAAPCFLLVAATTAAGQYLPLVPPKPWTSSGFPAVAIIGTKAVAAKQLGGANHSCYVFDVRTGEILVELTPGEDAQPGIVHSIAVDGTKAILGVPYADGSTTVGSGAAYLFDIETGAQLAKLAPSDEHNRYWFGVRVGISGDRVVVSNEAHEWVQAENGGWCVYQDHAAYVFDATTGSQVARISPDPLGEWKDAWIGGVAIDGPTVAVSMGTGSPSYPSLTLRIDDALPIAPVILAMGMEEWSQPLLGGVMVPKPTWLHYVGYTNAAGEMELHIPNLPVIPQETDVYLQAWIQDPAGPKGYAATNAVRATRQ